MKKYKKLYSVVFILAVFFGAQNLVSATTGVPKILSHQGRLLDSSGNLLGGAGTDYCFKFSIYDDAVAGAPDTKLWPSAAPSIMTINVKNGVFNAGIGDTSAGGDVLDFNFQDNDTIFLNVEVAVKVGADCAGGDEVFENLSPRQRIFSSGYAVSADTVDGFHASQSASGNQIPVLTSGNLILGGNVGIGTTTPSQLLAVHGSALISGNLTLANLTATGTLNVSGLATLQSGYISQASSTIAGDLSVSGNVLFSPFLDSISAFLVRNAAGNETLLAADTANSRIKIGDDGPLGYPTTLLVLDNKADAGDPSGINGAMYYNSNTNKFRCFENGIWKNCGAPFRSFTLLRDAVGVTMTDVPSGQGAEITDLVSRSKIDLTEMNNCRGQFASSLSTVQLNIQYSPNQKNWFDLCPYVSAVPPAKGISVGDFGAIPADAKTDVFVRAMIIGNGKADPIIRYVQIDVN